MRGFTLATSNTCVHYVVLSSAVLYSVTSREASVDKADNYEESV
jgi:hypothetical protein